MFSFLKGRSATAPETATDHDRSPETATDPERTDAPAPSGDETPRPRGGASASAAEQPTSAAPDHPLAAMVWDSPDVPRPDDGSAAVAAEATAGDAPGSGGTSHGLDVGALVAPPSSTPGPGFGAKDEARTDALKPAIVEALSTIYDPEIPVNIYELGLIYDIVSDAEGRVTVTMTLTSPACPSAQQLPSEARYKTKAVAGVTDAYVDVVWEPPWTKDMMSETARLALGMF